MAGTLLRCDEAKQLIDHIEDPVTRNLLNMAFVQVVKSCFMEKRESPQRDFDMMYFVAVLKPFFSEHQVLCRTLAGEKVGAWFEEKV